jgi:membrane protein implicated in regulation of membrane protease activity
VPGFFELFADHPFWAWLAVGVVLLIAEAMTGTGWLLWPAVAAGVTAVTILTGHVDGPPMHVGIFAALTIVLIALARPWLSRAPKEDLNDRARRVVGLLGEARGDFIAGHGRVFVDGAEWPAELDGGGELKAGERIVVAKCEGARLLVRRG